jgi:hypothetical protein
MKIEVIPKDSRYIPLTQQKWCCSVTCIQMIMLRHKIPLVPSELIGHHMGLIVPKGDTKLFWNVQTGDEPKAGYGTQGGKSQYGPNAFFKKMGIPLKMTWSLISKFKTIEQFKAYLSKIDGENRDVLVCFDHGILFGGKYHGGHICVLDQVFLEKGEARIIDPDYFAPKWRMVKIDILFDAMKFHGKEKSGGFWELTPILRN